MEESWIIQPRIPDTLYTLYFIYIPHETAHMIAKPRRRSERVNTFVGLLEFKKREDDHSLLKKSRTVLRMLSDTAYR